MQRAMAPRVWIFCSAGFGSAESEQLARASGRSSADSFYGLQNACGPPQTILQLSARGPFLVQ
eukprot:8953177-Pyramimonas_sp.AAC.1